MSGQKGQLPCPFCDGDGYVDKWYETSKGEDYPVSIPCDRCNGTGVAVNDSELQAGS